MPTVSSNARKQLLDPIERSSEVLFGLIMVLTFTGSLRASGLDHDSVNRMLVGALGCNLAWGIIDAVMYLIATLSQRGHNLVLVREIQNANPERGRALINDAMSEDLAAVLTDTEVESVRARLLQLPQRHTRAHLRGSDYLAAAGVFLGDAVCACASAAMVPAAGWAVAVARRSVEDWARVVMMLSSFE